MGKLLILRIFSKNTNSASLDGFDLPSSVVVILVVVRGIFDFPPEKITAIGITILEIIITDTQVIITIATFPDKNSMVTDIMPKYSCYFNSAHIKFKLPLKCILLNRFRN